MGTKYLATLLAFLVASTTAAFSAATSIVFGYGKRREIEKVQRAHFQYFLDNQDPNTGLVLDRSTPKSPASIAAVGFALTAYPVAVQRGWISRNDACAYTLKVLRTLSNAPQGDARTGTSGYHGYFYHMLDPKTGLRATAPTYWDSELSSIDTALLMAGVLFARDYYTANSASEADIRSLADALYRRVEWPWMMNDKHLISLAWSPEHGMMQYAYNGYSEAVLLMLLAIGSPTYPLPADAWDTFMSNSEVANYYNLTYVRAPNGPLFCHQYPHVWVDFRGIRDNLNRKLGLDYFENSRRATLAQYRYALENPKGYRAYGKDAWGNTASDGPGNVTKQVDGKTVTFEAYRERGVPNGWDDGTIAPTAALSSMPFTPTLSLRLMRTWLKTRPELFGAQGFVDAFNPTFDTSTPSGWVDSERVGIDQGPIVLMMENYRSGFVWNVMRKNEYLRKALKDAGFTGGWLR